MAEAAEVMVVEGDVVDVVEMVAIMSAVELTSEVVWEEMDDMAKTGGAALAEVEAVEDLLVELLVLVLVLEHDAFHSQLITASVFASLSQATLEEKTPVAPVTKDTVAAPVTPVAPVESASAATAVPTLPLESLFAASVVFVVLVTFVVVVVVAVVVLSSLFCDLSVQRLFSLLRP